MEKISYKEFVQFLNSTLDEADYFDCDRTSLITLKDYLNELQQKHNEFQKQVKEPLSSIKKKNKWIKGVLPVAWPPSDLQSLMFRAEKGPGICVCNSQGQFKHIGGYALPLITIIHDMQVRNREKILTNSLDELREMDEIVRNFHFVCEEFKTVSGNFTIKNSPYANGVSIWCPGDARMDIQLTGTYKIEFQLGDIKTFSKKEEFYEKEGIDFKELTYEEKENFVKKLCIKR